MVSPPFLFIFFFFANFSFFFFSLLRVLFFESDGRGGIFGVRKKKREKTIPRMSQNITFYFKFPCSLLVSAIVQLRVKEVVPGPSAFLEWEDGAANPSCLADLLALRQDLIALVVGTPRIATCPSSLGMYDPSSW